MTGDGGKAEDRWVGEKRVVVAEKIAKEEKGGGVDMVEMKEGCVMRDFHDLHTVVHFKRVFAGSL